MNLVEWLESHVTVVGTDETENDLMVETLVGSLIVTDSQALLRYRMNAEGSIVSANTFTYLDLKRQIELLFFNKQFGWGPDNFGHEDQANRDVLSAALPSDFAVGLYEDPNEFSGK